MKSIQVVVTDYIEPDLDWEKQRFQDMGVEFSAHQLKFAPHETLVAAAKNADVVIVNMAPMDVTLIGELERCKMIIRHGIGYDNVDVEAATQRGILVVNVPDYCVPEVAEQAVTLIMACQRKLLVQKDVLNVSAQEGKWVFQPVYPVYRLAGKTVGIVGFGRIGSTVYRMLQGFGGKFLIYDPYLSEQRKQEYGIQTCSFEELLVNSDVVTIHCPLKWRETYHMFDAAQFKLMKPTAILVNTARGGIVNLDALDEALKAGELAHAGIDVYEVEPPPAGLQLLHNENATCTPHLSWLSEESGWTIREKIVAEVQRYLKGEKPLNLLNPEVLPDFNSERA
jgi:D-3-phosphoglycerate dehydrogenase